MRSRITGTVTDISEEAVILDQEHTAWEILISRGTFPELAAQRGRNVTLHTLEYLEGNQFGGALMPRLVGFTRPQDREFFLRFIEVKGIGLRKALRALEQPSAVIAGWIEAGDVKLLSTLQGIGRRGAELIVAQLRGKLSALAQAAGPDATERRDLLTRPQRDAVEILVAWGDPRVEAERWIREAGERHSEIQTADEWVRAAYRMKSGAER